MKKQFMVIGEMVRDSPIMTAATAHAILDHLRELQQDADFMAGFEQWKEEREKGRKNNAIHGKENQLAQRYLY
mgnify:FL=1